MIQNKQDNQPLPEQKAVEKKPNETGSIRVEGFVKIFDPKTNEIFVEKRA